LKKNKNLCNSKKKMGCMQSVSTPNEEVSVVPGDTAVQDVKPEVAPTQETAPVGLVGLVNTAVHGPRTHCASVLSVSEPPPLKRKISLVLKSENSSEDDIEISKHGDHYILRGTRVVMDITNCEVLGYLEKDTGKFIKECNDYVKAVCDKYNVHFQQ
jgi:hypothetical protein